MRRPRLLHPLAKRHPRALGASSTRFLRKSRTRMEATGLHLPWCKIAADSTHSDPHRLGHRDSTNRFTPTKSPCRSFDEGRRHIADDPGYNEGQKSPQTLYVTRTTARYRTVLIRVSRIPSASTTYSLADFLMTLPPSSRR